MCRAERCCWIRPLFALILMTWLLSGCGGGNNAGGDGAGRDAKPAASGKAAAMRDLEGPIDLEQLTVEVGEDKFVDREPIGKVRCEKGGIDGFRFAPDGSMIYSYLDKTIYVLDPQAFVQTAAWEPVGERIRGLEVSRDGGTLVTWHEDKALRVWDTETGTVRSTYTGHSKNIEALAVSPDGKWVVSAEMNDLDEPNVYVAWDAATGMEKWTQPTSYRSPKPLAISPDGKTVAMWAPNRNNAVLLCDAETGSPQRKIPFKQNHVSWMRFSPDGAYLLVSRGIDDAKPPTQHMALISLADLQPKWIASNHTRFGKDVEFSPDGSMIGFGGEEHGGKGEVARVFNTADGSLRFSLKRRSSRDDVGFSSDGAQLATIGFGGYCELRDTSAAAE